MQPSAVEEFETGGSSGRRTTQSAGLGTRGEHLSRSFSPKAELLRANASTTAQYLVNHLLTELCVPIE